MSVGYDKNAPYRRHLGEGGWIGEHVSVGPNCQIGRDCTISGCAKIGKNCVIGGGVRISGFAVVRDDCQFYGNVDIDGYAWIGANVTLMANGDRRIVVKGRSEIAAGTTVRGGAFITQKLPHFTEVLADITANRLLPIAVYGFGTEVLILDDTISVGGITQPKEFWRAHGRRIFTQHYRSPREGAKLHALLTRLVRLQPTVDCDDYA